MDRVSAWCEIAHSSRHCVIDCEDKAPCRRRVQNNYNAPKMPRMKAATVSDQTVRKRKRKTLEDEETQPVASAAEGEGPSEAHRIVGPDGSLIDPNQPDPIETTTTTSVPTKAHDGGKKPRRAPKKSGAGRPSLARNNSSTFVETSIPWPEHFTKLAQVHRAVNLVYTFLCTRKHLATTLENLRSTVEANIQRELVVEDVAQITALVPKAINFAYVDEAMLLINVMGAEDNLHGRSTTDFAILGPEPNKGEHKEVLLFEFIDGDLKRHVQHKKTGEPTKATTKLRHEELKMPVYSQKQMMNLIEKRNLKFTSAVNAFLNQCAEEGVDAVEKIKKVSEAFVPVPTESRHSTPGPDR